LYRCYLTLASHIVWGEDLEAQTLDRACDEGMALVDRSSQIDCDGFEIWSRADLLVTVRLDDQKSHVKRELHDHVVG
jgi:hypothetical protein